MGSAQKRVTVTFACIVASLLLIAPAAPAAKPGKQGKGKSQLVVAGENPEIKGDPEFWAMRPSDGKLRPLLDIPGNRTGVGAAVTPNGRRMFALVAAPQDSVAVFSAAPWGRRAKLLSVLPPYTIGPVALSDTGRLVFSRQFAEGLWTMNADGTGLSQLYAGCAPCADGITRLPGTPAISGDGRLVAFHEGTPLPGQPPGLDWREAIRLINADGTGLRTVREFPPPEIPCCRLAISGDGRRVASNLVDAPIGRTVGMAVMATDGTGLFRHPLRFFDSHHLLFNPGGSLVAYSSIFPAAPQQAGTHVLNPATGTVRQVRRGGPKYLIAHDWARLAPEPRSQADDRRSRPSGG